MSGAASNPLATRCGPLRMANPVLAASGTFGYGDAFTDFFPLDALGGFVTKTLFLAPRDGNPAPRIAETSCGMLRTNWRKKSGAAQRNISASSLRNVQSVFRPPNESTKPR